MALGIVVTFSFVAPLAVASASSRRRSDAYFALLAAAGVVILGGVDRSASLAGISFALIAGGAWVGVAYASRYVGRRSTGIDGLALAIPVAAIVCLPFGAAHAGALNVRVIALGLVVAVGGLILPYALELEALRRLEPRTLAVVYSIDPALAALVGLIALGQALSIGQGVGITAVIAASAGATLTAPTSPPPIPTNPP